MKIETLMKRERISILCSNILRNAGINTVEDLSKKTAKEIVDIVRSTKLTNGCRILREISDIMCLIK